VLFAAIFGGVWVEVRARAMEGRGKGWARSRYLFLAPAFGVVVVGVFFDLFSIAGSIRDSRGFCFCFLFVSF
jgi:hypothetical protein